MSGSVQPDEAASSLADVRRRQQQVIDAVMIPLWYWWVVAASMIAIGAAVDTKRVAVLATVLPVAIALVAGLTLAMILGAYRRARVRSSELLGGRGALSIVGFVWLVVGASLGTAYALRAAGAVEPATIGTAVGAILMVTGGPVLGRWLRQVMLANRAGGGR
jgi:FtsH-binding integral membrane protein